jgi:hypothetical protein
MGIIKKPLEIDFVVDPRPLRKVESLALSAFIKNDKAKRDKKKADTVLQQIEKGLREALLIRKGKIKGISVKELLAKD